MQRSYQDRQVPSCFQALTLFLQFTVMAVAIAFCGHLGTHELAAVSLAITVRFRISQGDNLEFLNSEEAAEHMPPPGFALFKILCNIFNDWDRFYKATYELRMKVQFNQRSYVRSRTHFLDRMGLMNELRIIYAPHNV